MSFLVPHLALFGWLVVALLVAHLGARAARRVWRRLAGGTALDLLAHGSSAVVVGPLVLGGMGVGARRALALVLLAQFACLAFDLARQRRRAGPGDGVGRPGHEPHRRRSAWDKAISLAPADAGVATVAAAAPRDHPPRSSLHARVATFVGRPVGRHWRGELPLWVAFWVSGVLANLAALAIATLLAGVSGLYRDYNPYLLALTIVGVWISVLAIVMWQTVGLWRTTRRCIASRKSVFWARSAQLVVVLVVINTSIDVARVTYPQLVEAAKLGLLGDPDIPDFTVEVSPDGRALAVAGGIKFGLARAIERALAAAPDVGIVRLDSVGGRGGEAEKIFDIVQHFGLDTHVGRECVSACTLVFAAGRQRWVERDARLGYHGIAFPGYTDAELEGMGAAWYARMVAAGVAPDFVARARRVPSASIWYPTTDELLAAGVVTEVVADDLFRLRHAGEVTEAEIARRLRQWAPLYATMATVAPRAFAAAVAIVGDGFRIRRSDAEITRQLRIQLHELVQRHRARADDPAVLAVGLALVEQLGILRRVDRELCHAHGRGTADLATLVDRLPPERLADEQALAERVLQTTIPGAAPDMAPLDPGRRALLQRLRDEVGQDSLALLQLDKPDELERRRLCDVYVTLYSVMLELDAGTASTLLRHGFAGP